MSKRVVCWIIKRSNAGCLDGSKSKMENMTPKTMFEKIWDAHVVRADEGKPAILYIDLHLVHEVTSAQAFDGLRMSGRKVRRPDLTLATEDHNVPTTDRSVPIQDPI